MSSYLPDPYELRSCTDSQGQGWEFDPRYAPRIRSSPAASRTDESWDHVAIQVDGTTVRFLLNGQPEGETTLRPVKHADQWNECLLGAAHEHTAGVTRFFSGEVDEIRISSGLRYDRPFTPARRFEPDFQTLGLYHVDEDAGPVLIDSSGRNNHGRLHHVERQAGGLPPDGDRSNP